MLAVCGIPAAAMANENGGTAGTAELHAALAAPNIAGRWTGSPFAIRADPSRCGPDGCALTLDIVACATGWCGIEVKAGNICAGEALTLRAHGDMDPGAREETTREARPALGRFGTFEGRFSLSEGTQAYFVEANYRPQGPDAPARLYFVGDTGPGMMMFRRSFPFQVTMERQGDAVCTSAKPIS